MAAYVEMSYRTPNVEPSRFGTPANTGSTGSIATGAHRQAVRGLKVICPIGHGDRTSDLRVSNLRKLGDELGVFVLPHRVRREDTFVELRAGRLADAIQVDRTANLQPEDPIGLDEHIHDPRGPRVVVTGVAAAADHVSAAVAHASL